MTGVRVLRDLERAREAHARRSRARLTGSVALYGAVLSVLALYITLTARVADGADYYTYELARPALLGFLAKSLPALLSGLALAALITHQASHVVATPLHPVKWVVVGGLFGFTVPFATGLLLPVSTALLDPAGVNAGDGGFWLSLSDEIIGAPVFGYVYGMLGVFVGLLAGLMLALGGWLVELANTSSSANMATYGPYAVSAALSLALAAAVMFGPFSLFEFLVESLGR